VVLSADARTRDFVGDNRGKASEALFLSVISVYIPFAHNFFALLILALTEMLGC